MLYKYCRLALRDGFLAGLRKQLASELSVVSANVGADAGFGEKPSDLALVDDGWRRVRKAAAVLGSLPQSLKTVTAPPRSTLYSAGNSLIFEPLQRSSVLIISNDGMVRLIRGCISNQ
jgi:hypothetical protein